MYNNKVRIEDALARVGVSFQTGRAKQTLICPLCKRKKLEVDFQKGVGQCMRAGCEMGGFNAVTLVSKVEGISTKEAFKELVNGGNSVAATVVTEFNEQAEFAPLPKIDKVYRSIFRTLSLSDRHEADLKKRGLTEEEIRSLGYVSITYKDKYSLPRKLLTQGFKERDLLGVPGFYRSRKKELGEWKDGDIAFVTIKSGILIPFLDAAGQIRELQMRQDEGTYKNGKYITVSSDGRYEGTKGHCYIHYAANRDFDMTTKTYKPVIRQNRILLTEGGLKADIIRKISGWPCIAVSGVNQYRSLEKELPVLKELGVKTIDLIFDMDYKVNPNVQNALKFTKELLKKNDFEVATHEWDDHYKGYDDFLAHVKRGIG